MLWSSVGFMSLSQVPSINAESRCWYEVGVWCFWKFRKSQIFTDCTYQENQSNFNRKIPLCGRSTTPCYIWDSFLLSINVTWLEWLTGSSPHIKRHFFSRTYLYFNHWKNDCQENAFIWCLPKWTFLACTFCSPISDRVVFSWKFSFCIFISYCMHSFACEELNYTAHFPFSTFKCCLQSLF